MLYVCMAQLHVPLLANHFLICGRTARQSRLLIVLLHAGCTEDEAVTAVDQAQLHFPMLAKPFWTDGRQGCHGLALIEGLEGLKRLVKGTGPPGVELPAMLQPFIEHGGCLIKARLA